jgi:hypothetical protein
MLLINKNANSTLILTLTEKVTLTSPYFLFRFINDVTNQEKAFISSDLSTQTQRYNKFLITETTGTNILTSGVITLSPTGYWHYEVYEQTSSTNTDYIQATNRIPIETGKARVVGTEASVQRYDSQSKTFVVYGT